MFFLKYLQNIINTLKEILRKLEISCCAKIEKLSEFDLFKKRYQNAIILIEELKDNFEDEFNLKNR